MGLALNTVVGQFTGLSRRSGRKEGRKEGREGGREGGRESAPLPNPDSTSVTNKCVITRQSHYLRMPSHSFGCTSEHLKAY